MGQAREAAHSNTVGVGSRAPSALKVGRVDGTDVAADHT
jgi:hypothetical protein